MASFKHTIEKLKSNLQCMDECNQHLQDCLSKAKSLNWCKGGPHSKADDPGTCWNELVPKYPQFCLVSALEACATVVYMLQHGNESCLNFVSSLLIIKSDSLVRDCLNSRPFSLIFACFLTAT